MKRNNENLSLGDVLKEFVSKNNLEKGLDKVHVRDAWSQQMGPAIQKYTRPLIPRFRITLELTALRVICFFNAKMYYLLYVCRCFLGFRENR